MGVTGDRALWEAESRGIDLIHLTIGELLDRQAAARPDKEALVYQFEIRAQLIEAVGLQEAAAQRTA